jgi:hypothetical protein
MIKAVTSATQTQPAVQPKVADQKEPQTKAHSAKTDTVHLSTAGKAAAKARRS